MKPQDERIKVGIWGLGRAGWGMHCPELDRFPKLFEIVAGCDLEVERTRSLAEKYGARVYTDPEDFLRDEAVELVCFIQLCILSSCLNIVLFVHTTVLLKMMKNQSVVKNAVSCFIKILLLR